MYIEFDLPEISEYAAGFPQYWLKILFVQSPSDRYQINALAGTYIRLVEAALVEYHSGAVRLREYWGTHTSLGMGAMHRSMSHFETCISNMYRATNCFRRLRRDPQRDPLSLELNVQRANFITDEVVNKFRTIRNEIHHLEEMVMDRRIAEGQPFALTANGSVVPHPTEPRQTIMTIDRLVIGTREVKFSELATSLREMSSFAVRISEFLPSSSSGTHNGDPA
jgi:hypothetical protein